FGNCTGYHACNGFTCRRPTSATMITCSVLFNVGIICMRGSEYIFQVIVIVGVLVFVPDGKSDGRSLGFSLKNAGKKFNLIGLFSLCSNFRLPGFTTSQISLN